MAVVAHNFPNANQLLMTKTWNWNNSDTHVVGLIATGTFNWVAGTYGYTTVAQFLANAGTGGGGSLVESTGTGYARQALTSVSVSTSTLYTTLVVGTNPSWAASTISAKYAFFYDAAPATGSTAIATTNDATTNQLIAYWDFQGTNTDSNGVYTLLMPTANAVAGALVQITAA